MPLPSQLDWEEFGQLLGRDHTGVVMPAVPKTIDRQTDILLSLLDETGKKATFFILRNAGPIPT